MVFELPNPEWLNRQYGICWDGQYCDMSGNFARVARIESKEDGRSLVLRISDPGRISKERLKRVHRYQAHVNTQGARTVLPWKTLEGDTVSTTVQGMTMEVFPFVPGRSPRRGDSTDIRRVGCELGRLHSAGTDFSQLYGEESLFQNHLAINQLMVEVREKRESTRDNIFHEQFIEYVEETERWIEAIESRRNGLVETGLHMDTGPQNMIIDSEDELWFIDCAHMVRGRRVFEICVTLYYLDPSSGKQLGEPARYQLAVESVEAAFLDGYTDNCEPPWSDQESVALGIERMLMFIHGVTYWTERWDEDTVLKEYGRWKEYHTAMRAELNHIV